MDILISYLNQLKAYQWIDEAVNLMSICGAVEYEWYCYLAKSCE